MYKNLIAILIFILLLPNTGQAFLRPTAMVTIKVIDSNGVPIEGANVHVGFIHPKATGWGTTTKSEKGLSDKNGEFIAKNDSTENIGITVEKDGYYHSGTGYEFEKVSLRRWQPWNPTIDIELKKKRNPIAMYANNTEWIEIPKLNTPVGYDLEKGDWVTPYGKGLVSDLLIDFYLEKRAYTDYKTDMTISFPNEIDGIQELYFDDQDKSYYKWPFEAPDSGYVKSVNLFENDTPADGYKTNKRKKVNYIFRVRTKLDKDGNIIDARYGKLDGEFGISRKGKTRLIYYFNPTGTRNLEFDPEQNLLKWSSRREEQVHRIESP